MSKDNLWKQCDDFWKDIGGADYLQQTGETRTYCTDGLYVHACGKTFDDGRDGDPVAGIEICECGLCLKLRTQWARLDTHKEERVTFKKKLTILNGHNHKAFMDSIKDVIPTFTVMARDMFEYAPGADGTCKQGCHLTFTCPICKGVNNHRGIYDEIGKGDGHRCSHCDCWPKGYYIKEVAVAEISR